MNLPVQICPVALPGREGRIREAPLANLHHLAGIVVDELRPYLDMPFALAGISFGALLAFEIAGRMHEIGSVPSALFLASHRAPGSPNPDRPLHTLNNELLLQKLLSLGGMDQEIVHNQEVLDLVLDTVRADLRASETYAPVPRTPLVSPFYIYAGRMDLLLEESGTSAWKVESTAMTRTRVLDGGHFLMNGEKDLWLAAIVDDLAAVLSRPMI